MAKIKVTQVELDGGIAYTTDEEILRAADEIRKKKETTKFRERQIVYVSDTENDWYLRTYLLYENGKHVVWTDDVSGGCVQEWKYVKDLTWIDKARIIAPPEAKWAAVDFDGGCFFYEKKPEGSGEDSWIGQELSGWFQASPNPCENWKALVVEL